MDSDYGKQMGKAIRAVLDMHADCVKLLADIDKELMGYESIFGNVIAIEQGTTISRRAYIAEGLIRLYARRGKTDQVLGINICFYDQNDSTFVEPIFVVANTRYQTKTTDPTEKVKRAWDPWYAFLAWAPDRLYNTPIPIDRPPKRDVIEQVTVAAAPLYTITNLDAATRLVDLVGRP